MARADLLLDIVKAGAEGNQELFRKTLEALIAEEKAKQHNVLADQLAAHLRINGSAMRPARVAPDSNGGDRTAFAEVRPRRNLASLVLPGVVREACSELVEEHHRADLLRSHGVEPRHRVLLSGPPGNGKTSLAEALAFELSVPLYVVRYESIIGSYLGETAVRLAKLFAQVRTERCVLFFDEFDVVGKERGDVHETGEIKRVVSSLLLQVDQLPSHVVVVAATNHSELLDRAAWRRFQVRVALPLPTEKQRAEWLRQFEERAGFSLKHSHANIAKNLGTMSFAELELFALDVQRRYILALPDGDAKAIVSQRLKQWNARVNANTSFRQPRLLKQVVTALDALDWYSAKHEGLGDLYEGLLEKNAEEIKRGAGQYFTPRALIDAIVAVIKPAPGERVQDPAVGTGGFLTAADRYVKSKTDDHYDLPEAEQEFQRCEAFSGVELVPDVRRLCLMNAMLHDIEGDIVLGDTLGPTGASLPKADVILTNPPFGTKKGGGGPTRNDITYPTSNKQLVFLQHIYRGLKPGGRAAVVLPDNVLFEEGVGQKVRADLMDKCDLHTILRLPTGIFYAQGVKTNVLFFTRGEKDKGNTKAVWFFDMRTNMPSFGKRTPFTRAHFAEFEKAYGEDPFGKSKRKDQGETGRFRKFTREEIAKCGDNLDISWLKDDSVTDHTDLPEPDEIAAEIVAQLQTALEEMQALQEELGGGA